MKTILNNEIIADLILLRGICIGDARNVFTDMYIKKYGNFREIELPNVKYPDLMLIKPNNNTDYVIHYYHPLVENPTELNKSHKLTNSLNLPNGYFLQYSCLYSISMFIPTIFNIPSLFDFLLNSIEENI